jgi:hypothetical protein
MDRDGCGTISVSEFLQALKPHMNGSSFSECVSQLPFVDHVVRAANRNVVDFGWEIAHEAVSPRPPIPLDMIGVRSHMYTHAAKRVGVVPRSRAISCRPAPNLSVTIRNFFESPFAPHRLCGRGAARRR